MNHNKIAWGIVFRFFVFRIIVWPIVTLLITYIVNFIFAIKHQIEYHNIMGRGNIWINFAGIIKLLHREHITVIHQMATPSLLISIKRALRHGHPYLLISIKRALLHGHPSLLISIKRALLHVHPYLLILIKRALLHGHPSLLISIKRALLHMGIHLY